MTNALFLGTEEDRPYAPYLKGMFGGTTTYYSYAPLTMLTPLEMLCTKNKITKVVCTQIPVLKKLLEILGNTTSTCSLADYQGSLFTYKSLEIVFISPLKQLFTVPYGKFIASRFISKVITPEQWPEPTEFSWELLTPANAESYWELFHGAVCIAMDIETLRKPLSIRCISYTGVFISTSGVITTKSVVLPITDEWALACMRRFNVLPPDKLFQNGKYDTAYLLRYNAAHTNWFWDTAHLFHSYYSELPKDLAFLNAFFLRKVVYWKDLAETTDLYQYYKYNALDGWATANVWIQQLLSIPDWARRNYALEFPMVYPCILSEMTGIRRDHERLQSARREVDEAEASTLRSLQSCIGSPNFNPGSPPQVVKLLRVLGCSDITSSGEAELKKASYRHPINARILGKVLDIRGLRKLRSTYLRTDDDAKQSGKYEGEGGAKEFNGRILYALNPHGTDTVRLASRSHHFWCGLQIQFIPRGPEVKQTFCADEGFFLAECDLEQAESRDTAYITGDLALIAAVSGTRDFHSVNASAVFGVPYADIYDDEHKKTKNKKLRDLSKRVNHGSNYNMGPFVLLETMGLEAVWEAKRLLRLPFTDPLDITEYLLCVFHKTYTKLKGPTTIKSMAVRKYLGILVNPPQKLFSEGTYYAWVAEQIAIHKKLISRAFHHTEYNLNHYKPEQYILQGDWTRYCFGKPDSNKLDLNSYVAHCPQSLNARTLNEAYLRIFYDVALPNPTTFRLHAQIHDSVLFSYAEGHEHLAERVRELMEIPVTVQDISGDYRTFTVPAALKLGKTQTKEDGTTELKRAIYWSETE